MRGEGKEASIGCVNEEIMADPSCWGTLGNHVAHASEAFCLKGGGAGVFIPQHLSVIG